MAETSPETPRGTPPSLSSKRFIMLILSYLGILALIPFLTEKDDREIQWHAKHGLVLAASSIVVLIGVGILNMTLIVLPGPNCLGCGLITLAWLVIVVVHIIAMVKAINGDRLTMPVITDFANRWQ